jgi:hypothetical protein
MLKIILAKGLFVLSTHLAFAPPSAMGNCIPMPRLPEWTPSRISKSFKIARPIKQQAIATLVLGGSGVALQFSTRGVGIN